MLVITEAMRVCDSHVWARMLVSRLLAFEAGHGALGSGGSINAAGLATHGIYALRNGLLAGGALFSVIGGELHIRVAYVMPGQRGRGIFSAVHRKLERHAAELGAGAIRVSTYAFEAPHVYSGPGYDRRSVGKGHGSGHDRIYFAKTIIGTAGKEAGNA